jgi:exodeoxyribonuclease VII small subunit
VPSDQQTLDFERALTELESVVERLERGDLPLEEALRVFERGVDLTRQCQGALKSAQQRVDALMKRNGEVEPEPFSISDTARDGAPEPP